MPKTREELAQLGEPLAVKISTPAGKTTNGTVYIHQWSGRERGMRAAKTLGLVWFLAILAVFIPIAHFVLVPLLLILGPILASSAYNQKSMVMGGLGACPKCEKELEIVKAKDRWPLQDICAGCYQNVSISKA